MADVKKPDWPQTPDGTIDWETVFEDSETGIIPALSKATTKELLHKSTVVVVQQLFTRKNDAPQVEKFIRELDLILNETEGSEDLPKMQESIISLLRRIKNGRIKKAAEYVAAKKKEAALSKSKKKKRKKKERRAEEKMKASTTLIGLVIAGLMMIIVAVIAFILVFSDGDEVSTDTSSQQQEETDGRAPEPEPEPEPEPIEKPELLLSDGGYPLETMTPEAIKELGPVVMILERFFWSGKVEGGSKRGVALVPVLVIKDDDLTNRICDYGPNLIDAINLALGRTVTGDEKASPDDLRHAGLVAMESVNKRLGKVWIRDLYLLHKVDGRLLTMSGKCQLVE